MFAYTASAGLVTARPARQPSEGSERAIARLFLGVQSISALWSLCWVNLVVSSALQHSSDFGSPWAAAGVTFAVVHGPLPFLCFFLRYHRRAWAYRVLLRACYVLAAMLIVWILTVVVWTLTADPGGQGQIFAGVYAMAAATVALDGIRLYGSVQLIVRLRRPEGLAMFGCLSEPREF
jgi:hypothetical protein